jgi:hypothetical protein
LLLLCPLAFPNFASTETSLSDIFCTSMIQPKHVFLAQEVFLGSSFNSLFMYVCNVMNNLLASYTIQERKQNSSRGLYIFRMLLVIFHAPQNSVTVDTHVAAESISLPVRA